MICPFNLLWVFFFFCALLPPYQVWNRNSEFSGMTKQRHPQIGSLPVLHSCVDPSLCLLTKSNLNSLIVGKKLFISSNYPHLTRKSKPPFTAIRSQFVKIAWTCTQRGLNSIATSKTTKMGEIWEVECVLGPPGWAQGLLLCCVLPILPSP